MNEHYVWILGEQIYLEVFRKEQFAGAKVAENVTENLSIPVNKVVLFQTVQHDGLRAVKQPTDSDEDRTTNSSWIRPWRRGGLIITIL